MVGQPGVKGWLEYRNADPQYLGKSKQARLLDMKTLQTDLLPVLQYANLVAIKEGGVAITGEEYSSRGAKSKAVNTVQTWWCVVHMEQGSAAPRRMNVRSSTGFDPNDDDDPERDLG